MRFYAILTSLFAPFLFASSVLASTEPPAGALIVGSSPKAKYKTVQAAVTAAPSGGIIFIESGTYNEQVFIPAGKNKLRIIGYSANASSYQGNTVTITQGLAQDSPGKPGNDKTATLRAWGDGLQMYNINLVNTRGKGSQALALSAWGTEMSFLACQFIGFQDTILSEKGKHFISRSLIRGATDYIFGQHSLLWIEKCVLQCVNNSIGYLTASGRDDPSNPSFFVINNSHVTGSAPAGAFYLGRPWRNYARVIFQNSVLGPVINSAGYTTWQQADQRTDHVTFLEYKNTGPGASGTRASFVKQANGAVTIGSLFGTTEWINAAFL
ncbi:hypothetical protein FKW77_003019 [Venturia effusa]|uniref:Pectinesterase n=1 Tax=Venturia effusa TaxID=50376 RepID=A0A517LF38_9PEZI|nr:hypothetical protein FKW77_003019 [Venturia effusa]